MNTTPTRMVYDRLHKATTAKYSHSTHQKRCSRRQENSRKTNQPLPPIHILIIKLMKVLLQCVVALFTRIAVRREAYHLSLRRRQVVIRP